MITAPSTPPSTRRKLIPDSVEPPEDTPSIAPPTPDSNTSSPRNAVAKRLSDLNLRSLDAESFPVRTSPKRKRGRSADVTVDIGRNGLGAIGRADVIQANASATNVLDNRPSGLANLPHERNLRTGAGAGVWPAISELSVGQLPAVRTICSETKPVVAVPARRRVIAKPKSRRKQSPPSPPKAPSTKPYPHTWQDHEITGHLLLDPDDDGYGINGIGFRPTPAIAYERSQKRKMQLSAWKVRESSEARERRGERRRKLDADGKGGKEGRENKTPSFVGNPMGAGKGDDEAGGEQSRDGEAGSGKREARIVRFA